MLNFNMVNTRKKLFLFPILFVCIVISSAIVYIYFSNSALQKTSVAIATDVIVQKNLKGRISVYQFLRNPTEQTQKVVIDNFNDLIKEVLNLTNSLESPSDITMSDKIINHAKEYMEIFESFSNERIADFTNNKSETKAILEKISNMVTIGLKLEEEILEINKSSINLRDEAYKSLNIDLSILVIIAISLFIVFSILVSSSIINSIESFKKE